MTHALCPALFAVPRRTNAVQAVVFDLGTVLLHLDWERAAARIGARTGKSVADLVAFSRESRWTHELGVGAISCDRFLRGVIRELGFSGTPAEFAAMWSDMFRENQPMLALAESLRGRLTRLILSNTNAIHMRHIFGRYSVIGGFDGYVLSHEVGLEKPDPRIYHYTLGRYGLTAARTVFVDDVEAHVEAARAVGLHAVHYRSPEQTAAELQALGLPLC